MSRRTRYQDARPDIKATAEKIQPSIVACIDEGEVSSAPIDLSFRPKSYFWPLGLETHLLTHVKGTERRAALQRLIDTGELDQIPAFLARSKLTEAERTALGRIYPMFMGGEYLPDIGKDGSGNRAYRDQLDDFRCNERVRTSR